nr:zinc finger, CCHC-type [Tanacetum cinerariifolium]
MKSYIDNLECLGHAMTQNLSVSLILVSLRKEYDGFVQNYNMHSMRKTLTELHAMLKLHEQTLPPRKVAPALHAIRAGRNQKNQKKKSHKAAKGNQRKGKAKIGNALVPAPSYAPKPKNPPTPKKVNPAKDVTCHQCSEVGYGTHICITTQGLRGSRKLKPRALSLYVGDVHRAGVKVIREFHLCIPSGLGLILHNYYYAPSITIGIISVSHFVQKGSRKPTRKDQKITRSDRKGEYMSQEFLDHLKDHGIIPHRTPLYMPQHNALESAARILNMVATKKVDNTPYEKLLDLPPDRKAIGHKWLFKKKTDMDGAVHTYKARLVAKGFTKTPGIDYKETFSLVADIRAIRILIAITMFYYYKIWQMNVKTAFLNGYLNEEVYMKQPEGEAAYILEIKIYRDRSKRLISLCQSAYIEKILKRFYMENSKLGTIPMQEKLKFSKSQSASTPGEIQRMQNIPYASAVGSIITKQSIFETSSTDVEYIAAFDASKEAVWIRKFISRLGVVPIIEKPINMYCDKTVAIAIEKDHGVIKGARHFRAKVHYLRETI